MLRYKAEALAREAYGCDVRPEEFWLVNSVGCTTLMRELRGHEEIHAQIEANGKVNRCWVVLPFYKAIHSVTG